MIRALNQKKGVDLLSAPAVTTKSGQRAVIEIVREFRYPTQFQPPQIPQTSAVAKLSTGLTGHAGAAVPAAVPGHADDADRVRNPQYRRHPGGRAGRRPGRRHDRSRISFRRWSSSKASSTTAARFSTGSRVDTVLWDHRRRAVDHTPNVINQPIFSTRKVTTSVSVWDGQTVVLGGLMREDVQKTEDRTPILGDIPLVGRLFRTNVDQHIKRNLVIFVTARLINPGGQPVNPTEEEEENGGRHRTAGPPRGADV